MPESVSLFAAVPDDVQPGSYFIAYIDDADGTIKFDQPISPQIPARSPNERSIFHLETNHLSGRHLGSTGRAGHLAGLHLEYEHLGWQDTIHFKGGHFYGPTGTTGRTQFAVKLFDARGLASASTPSSFTQTINTSPEAPRALAVASTQSLPAPQITLSFVPSTSLVEKKGGSR